MSDWNPTDDELRAIADRRTDPAASVADLARLVLRERARATEAEERESEAFMHGALTPAGWCCTMHAERARAEKAEAALARVEALCDEREAPGWGKHSGLLMAKWIREALAGAPPAAETCRMGHDLFGACELPHGHDGPHSRVPGGATEANTWFDARCPTYDPVTDDCTCHFPQPVRPVHVAAPPPAPELAAPRNSSTTRREDIWPPAADESTWKHAVTRTARIDEPLPETASATCQCAWTASGPWSMRAALQHERETWHVTTLHLGFPAAGGPENGVPA